MMRKTTLAIVLLALSGCPAFHFIQTRHFDEIASDPKWNECFITAEGMAVTTLHDIPCPDLMDVEDSIQMVEQKVGAVSTTFLNTHLILSDAQISAAGEDVKGACGFDPEEANFFDLIVWYRSGWESSFRHEMGHRVHEVELTGGDRFHYDCNFWWKLERRECPGFKGDVQ